MANISVYDNRKKISKFFSPWRFSVYLYYLLVDNAVSEECCPGLCTCQSFLFCISLHNWEEILLGTTELRRKWATIW